MCQRGTGPGKDALGPGTAACPRHPLSHAGHRARGGPGLQHQVGWQSAPSCPLLNGRERAALPASSLPVADVGCPSPGSGLGPTALSWVPGKAKRPTCNAAHPPRPVLKLAIYRSSLNSLGPSPQGLEPPRRRLHRSDKKRIWRASSKIQGAGCRRRPAIFKGAEHSLVRIPLRDEVQSRARPQTPRTAGAVQVGTRRGQKGGFRAPRLW